MNDLPPMNHRTDMIRFIEKDLGFCGCAAADEALEVLAVTLRFAKQYGDSFAKDDSQEE